MTLLSDIAKYQEMANDADLPLPIQQSARQVLAKLRPETSIEVLKTAATMRRYAASDDPKVRLMGVSWLAKHGLSSTSPAVAAPTAGKTQAIAERLIKVAERGRREGWTKAKREEEIFKILDADFPKSRRTR